MLWHSIWHDMICLSLFSKFEFLNCEPSPSSRFHKQIYMQDIYVREGDIFIHSVNNPAIPFLMFHFKYGKISKLSTGIIDATAYLSNTFIVHCIMMHFIFIHILCYFTVFVTEWEFKIWNKPATHTHIQNKKKKIMWKKNKCAVASLKMSMKNITITCEHIYIWCMNERVQGVRFALLIFATIIPKESEHRFIVLFSSCISFNNRLLCMNGIAMDIYFHTYFLSSIKNSFSV